MATRSRNLDTAVERPTRPIAVPRPTARPQLDEAVARLQEASRELVRLSLEQRIGLARSMQEGYLKIAEPSVQAACRAKGIPLGTPAEGEEWVGPAFVVRHLRLIQESLDSIRRTGNPPTGKVGHTVDGRLAVQVFPANRIDALLYNGVRVDVHLQRGVTEEQMNASRARFYKAPDHDGRVVLVLGAGNINAIVSMDLLTKLFNEGKVCLVKMNPVNSYLGPYLEAAFAEAIACNFLAIVYGGANEGEYLAHHPEVDEIHLTGSDRTYEAIVWGPPGPERAQRMERGTPLLTKPVAAELGNVSPAIVVPGPYTDKELAYQAEDILSGLVYNASFNCNAPKVLITPKGWPLREALLAAVERVLAQVPTRKAYYPGARERWNAFSKGHGDVRKLGTAGEEALPWALIPGLDPQDRSERAFREESFCPILFETQVGSADPVDFLDRAVDFANERLWGTLCAGLVVHPKVTSDPALRDATERAIARLRYGAVSVNAWSGYVFAFGTPPWGAYPGSTATDIQSGVGWVHNTPMLEGIEKAVLRHPITMRPKPPTFPSHRNAHRLVRRVTALEEQASWAKVPGVLAAAMRA